MSKTAYIFPGQGAQAPGMGRELYESSSTARARFEQANEILGFDIAKILFEGTAEELARTSVTQPAIFLHSVILAEVAGINPDITAGHSLGEFSALVAAGALDFAAGLQLVATRAAAMQRACDLKPSTMAAIVGLEDAKVEAICAEVTEKHAGLVVVPANYNAPGQLVISGDVPAVEAAVELAKAAGSRLSKVLQVNGAFHSPLMEPARAELAQAIADTTFNTPRCPICQNVHAALETDPNVIRQNLIAQLTAPVRWTQSVQTMAGAGATKFIELGPGKVLQGLVKRIAPDAEAESRAV